MKGWWVHFAGPYKNDWITLTHFIRTVLEILSPSVTNPTQFLCPSRIMITYLVISIAIYSVVDSRHYSGRICQENTSRWFLCFTSLPMMQFCTNPVFCFYGSWIDVLIISLIATAIPCSFSFFPYLIHARVLRCDVCYFALLILSDTHLKWTIEIIPC